MFTVGRLARSCGLSRSTLLYYDTIGLLRPSGRSVSNYRTYTAMDAERLKQICTYREAGLPLKDIAELLDAADDKPVGILEKQIKQVPLRVAAADSDDVVPDVAEQPRRGRVIPRPVGDQGLRNGCPDIGEDAARRRHFHDHPFGFINLPGSR